jgi:hypothetical protein
MAAPASGFDRDRLARHYAALHFRVDPGVREVYHLPTNAPERVVRLLEVNDEIVERSLAPYEPIDFGVNRGEADEHTLSILDITPRQWGELQSDPSRLPPTWSLEGAVPLRPGEE